MFGTMPDHIMHAYSVPQSCQILCDLIDCSLTTGLLCPWDFPGKNTTLATPWTIVTGILFTTVPPGNAK